MQKGDGSWGHAKHRQGGTGKHAGHRSAKTIALAQAEQKREAERGAIQKTAKRKRQKMMPIDEWLAHPERR